MVTPPQRNSQSLKRCQDWTKSQINIHNKNESQNQSQKTNALIEKEKKL